MPAILASLQLVLMELLADFGAASILNLKTLTTTIYKAWYGFFSPALAAQIASILVLIAVFIFYSEQKLLGKKSYSLIRSENELSKKRPAQKTTSKIFIGFSLAVVSFSLILPISRLVWSSFHANFKVYANTFTELSLNTMGLGVMGALAVVATALLLVAMSRFLPGVFSSNTLSIVRIGYAIPGTVLAVALFLPLQYLQKISLPQFLFGGVFALITGYVVRFLSVGISPLKNSSQRRPSLFEDAARSLGISQINVFLRVTIPMLWPSMIKAFLLVFVDIVKEMPLTLMLRPFGWDTFAVTIFSLSSEGLWNEASIPSLILIGFGAIPCYLLIHDRKSYKRISHA